MTASRDDILKAEDLPFEDVPVPEWGGITVRIRALRASEQDSFTASSTVIEDGPDGKKTVRFVQENQKARYLVRCIVGEDGRRPFADEDAVELGNKSAAALERLYDVARRLNNIGQTETLRGNSSGEPSGASPIDSPASSATPTSIASSPA
jgi:hypothetical protein